MRQACRSINAARRDRARSRLSGWGRYRHVEASNQVRAAVRSGRRVEVRPEPPDVIGEELVDGAEGESPGPAGPKTRDQGREFEEEAAIGHGRSRRTAAASWVGFGGG